MDIKSIVILEEAAQDMLDGKAFYEMQTHGVGNYFWDSVIADIESLYIYAGVHELHDELFRMLSRRFPYAIYYQLSNNTAQILAVLPIRRDPQWIFNRLNR